MDSLSQLWSTLCLSLRFVALLFCGIIKAAIFGPIAVAVLLVGNSAVTIALWPAHVFWTYYCFARAKHLGPVLKVFILLGLVVPVLLYPIIVLLGSLLLGIGYGIITPIVDTFEAINDQWRSKYVQFFVAGTWGTVTGSCTIVHDFRDLCLHSYFSYMDDLREKQPREEQQPLEIKILRLPGCLFVGLLGMLVDVPIITLLAIWKSPYMLLKGWKQLLRDFIVREGPFSDSVCLPFATFAVLFWPLVVILAILAAFMSSFYLGFHSAIVAYQEDSIQLGLTYIISAISLFDEYSNDLLYMREGSCFPRPPFHSKSQKGSKNSAAESSSVKQYTEVVQRKNNTVLERHASEEVSNRRPANVGVSKERRHIQIWDRFFQSCEHYGHNLVQDGAVKISDLQQWLRTGKCKIVGIGLPAYCILQNLLHAEKPNADMLFLFDEGDITKSDRSDDQVFKWFIEPLMIIKDQIKACKLQESETAYLENLVLFCQQSQRMETHQNGGMPPQDEVRKAELEALSRRLQGITTTLSRMPTFRRRYQCVVRVLLQIALQTVSKGLEEPLPKSGNDRKPNRSMKAKDRLTTMFMQGGSKKDAAPRTLRESTVCGYQNV